MVPRLSGISRKCLLPSSPLISCHQLVSPSRAFWLFTEYTKELLMRQRSYNWIHGRKEMKSQYHINLYSSLFDAKNRFNKFSGVGQVAKNFEILRQRTGSWHNKVLDRDIVLTTYHTIAASNEPEQQHYLFKLNGSESFLNEGSLHAIISLGFCWWLTIAHMIRRRRDNSLPSSKSTFR